MRKHLITAAVLASCAVATSAYAVDVGENTTVGGVVFLDVSNISLQQQAAGGLYSDVNPSGTGFDVKRFYLTVDHKFNDIWSANLTPMPSTLPPPTPASPIAPRWSPPPG